MIMKIKSFFRSSVFFILVLVLFLAFCGCNGKNRLMSENTSSSGTTAAVSENIVIDESVTVVLPDVDI